MPNVESVATAHMNTQEFIVVTGFAHAVPR
jgi:hypothetical protein